MSIEHRIKKMILPFLCGLTIGGVAMDYQHTSPPEKIIVEKTIEKIVVIPPKTREIEDSPAMIYGENPSGNKWKVKIPISELLKYKEKKDHWRGSGKFFVDYVTHNNKYVKKIAKEIVKGSKTKEEAAQWILDFVHTQVYELGFENTSDKNYIRYPIETLIEKNGDCEDFSILGAALMKAVDIDVGLLHYRKLPGKKTGHVAIGIAGRYKGKPTVGHYTYAEATGNEWDGKKVEWKIGQIPEDRAGLAPLLYIVK